MMNPCPIDQPYEKDDPLRGYLPQGDDGYLACEYWTYYSENNKWCSEHRHVTKQQFLTDCDE